MNDHSRERKEGRTEDCHDVLAIEVAFGADLLAPLAQDLLAILPEEVVQVPQAREWLPGEVSEQLEYRHRNVVPRRAEEYDCIRGLGFDVFAGRSDILGLSLR